MNPLKLFSALSELKKAYQTYKVLAPLADQLITNPKTLDQLHSITETLDKAVATADALKEVAEATKGIK